MFDTAQSYFNEEEVGNAIVKSGVSREEIFLTSKVWIDHYGDMENIVTRLYGSINKFKNKLPVAFSAFASTVFRL